MVMEIFVLFLVFKCSLKGWVITFTLFLRLRFWLPSGVGWKSDLWNNQSFQVKCKQFHLKIAKLTLSLLLAAGQGKQESCTLIKRMCTFSMQAVERTAGKRLSIDSFPLLFFPPPAFLTNTFKIYWQNLFFPCSETCWNKNLALFKGPMVWKCVKGATSCTLTLLLP